MDIRERMITLREEQRKIAADYEEIIKAYNADELVNKNTELKKALAACQSELEKIRRELSAAQTDNDRLKLALQEQVWNERLNILKISREKLDAYFGRARQGQLDQLSAVEYDLKANLNRIKRTAGRQLDEGKIELNQKIAQLETEVEERFRAAEAEFNTEYYAIDQLTNEQYKTLKDQELSPEILKERTRQNQVEMKIGLNWINKIGILLILLGVGAAFQYSFANWMNDYLKSASFFLLGAFFVLGGEIFFRKRKNVFASGLLGGGVAILYGSIFYSYFWLKLDLFTLYTALSLSILVTVSTVLLSLRYNSQTIGSFGLVGGFLPFISFVEAYGLNTGNIILLMGYLFILNLALLSISLKKQWNILSYLSFFLNTLSLIYIADAGPRPLLAVGYTIVTFLMYLSVTLAYPLVNKKSLLPADVILLGFNTAISSMLIFSLCDIAGFALYRGAMAILFSLVYLGLGLMTQRNLSAEKWTRYLFYATSLTFAILVIPFQFGIHWWALGWTVEAVILILIGSQKSIRAMETTGWGIFLFSTFIFGLTDLLPYFSGINRAPYFEFKYLTVTVGQLLVLTHYQFMLAAHKIPVTGNRHDLILFYKYWVIAGFWVYLIHLGDLICRLWITIPGNTDYYRLMTFALITIAYGYAMARIRPFADKFTRGMAVACYLLADLACIIINFFYPVLNSGRSDVTTAQYWAFGMLVLFNVFVFLNLRGIILSYLRRDGFNLENYPVILGVFLLANSTAMMMVQFHLEFANILFSLFFLIMALGFIGYGFIKRYMTIRHWGLGLVVFATGKFFVFDLSYLGALGKIAAYFGFGLVLLAISFIYQKVKTNTEVTTDNAPKL